MKTGLYTLKSYLNDHNIDQIIIPEIQRDYVWKTENVVSLMNSIQLNSLREITMRAETSKETLDALSPAIRDIVLRELENKRNYCNVGFIYAYFDIDLPGKFMLIDGQQRLTTLFLLLLCLSIKENKQENFKRAYFKNGILKFDYKVRESAHNFMYRFVNHVLNGNEFKAITDQFWYFSEYNADETIQSIIQNYETIINFTASSELSLQYVEECVEFWYFDTKESKQGEELYIYMNSRGESVSSGESLKAILLNGLSDKDKHLWGAKWEEWQNFFWINRSLNINADKGLEEFIKWIQIIEIIKKNPQSSIQSLEIKIRRIKDIVKITAQDLSFSIIDQYFEALARLMLHKDHVNFNSLWLSGTFPIIDYIKFLPLLFYTEIYKDASETELRRCARFFLNITRFSAVSKNPIESLVSALLMTKSFVNSEYRDIADLIELNNISSFENLITKEEQHKFIIYKYVASDFRVQIEKVFWLAEDNRILDGKIRFLWNCISFDPSNNLLDEITLANFENIFHHFNDLFKTVDDLLRRALLTKGDYSIWDGRTATLSGDRYSFIGNDITWRQQLLSEKKSLPYKNLIIDYSTRIGQNPKSTKSKTLENIVTEFHINTTKKDWIYYFVKYPQVLAYCRKKLVCFQNAETELDKIVLLQSQNAGDHNWDWLKDVITFEDQLTI